MAQVEFEHTLLDLFAEAPAMQGGTAFLAAVEARLERGWMMRRWLIGGLGAVGGLVAASQWATASLSLRRDSGLASEVDLVSAQISNLLSAPAAAMGTPAETLVLSAALAIVALVLGVTRLVREI